MDAHLTDGARTLLDKLFTTPGDQNRYRLTLLKKLPQSVRPTKIKEAIADFETLADLHGQLSGPLSTLDLGTAGIRYFAGSVQRSRLFLLKQRADNDLDTSVFGLLHDIRGVTEVDGMSDTQKVSTIRALMDKGRTSAFEQLKYDLSATARDERWFDVLEAVSLRLHNRPSPILCVITFERNDRAASLITVIDQFKHNGGVVGPGAPTDFLDIDKRAILIRDDRTF